jgi:hypothetical protein
MDTCLRRTNGVTDTLRMRYARAADAVLETWAQVEAACVKANFNPGQLRIPRGRPGGGRWTRDFGGSAGLSDPAVVILASFSPPEPPDDPPPLPDIPPGNPRRRTEIMMDVAYWLKRNAARVSLPLRVISVGHWLYERLPTIESFLDEPRTLEDLIDRAKQPRPGYDRHHIVEQTGARLDRFPDSMIEAPENIVLVPRMRHWQINRWYSVGENEFGGLSPRQYLRGKSWDERRRVGLLALQRFGVLKP